MTTDSELEGLQCAPFHAPVAVGIWDVRARNLCLQARLQQLTGASWDVSCQHNEWTMSFLCMTPAVTLDNLGCARFVKRSHEWPPEQWTRPEVEEAGRLVAWSYKWDMAKQADG